MKAWIYVLAVVIFSALLVAFASDLEKGIPIEPASTNTGKQAILINIAKLLGFRGSLVVALLATGISVYVAMNQYRKSK